MLPSGELTCKQMVELVTEYLEGSLPPRDRERFETHLAGCRGCRAYLAQMRLTIQLAGTLTEDDIPEVVQQRLLDTFRAWNTRAEPGAGPAGLADPADPAGTSAAAGA